MHFEYRFWFWIPIGLVIIPSTFLFIKILLAIRAEQKLGHFKTLFYRLFTVQSLIELPHMLNFLACRLLITDQLAGSDFLMSTKDGLLPPFFYYSAAHFFYVQVWGVMMQSLARFGSTIPRLDKYLSNIPSYAWFLANTLVPFAVIFRFFFQEAVKFKKDDNGTAIIDLPPHVVHSNAMQSVVVTAVGSVFCAACYAVVLRRLLLIRSIQSIAVYRHERTLTMIGFFLFLSQCSMTACYLIIMIASHTNDVLTTVEAVRDGVPSSSNMHIGFRLWFWVPVGLVILPSTLLLVKLLLAIRSEQKQGRRKTLFYRLFMVQSLIELPLVLLYLAGRLFIKDQLAGRDFILSTNGLPFFPAFYYYGTLAYLFYVQVWGVMMQSLARFASTLPRLEKLLNNIPGFAWFLINTFVPRLVLLRLLLQDSVSFIKDKDGLAIIYALPHVVHSNAIQSLVVTVIGSIFCAACYAVVLRSLLLFRHQQSSITVYRHEITLTLVGFFLFLSQCSMTACYLTIMVAAHNIILVHIVRNLIIFPVVLVTFVNSWMLFLTNSTLRARMF